jgi:hypothetical protein
MFFGGYEPPAQRNLVHPSSEYKKTEAAGSSKMLLSMYLTTKSHVPLDQHNLNIHCDENFKAHTIRESKKNFIQSERLQKNPNILENLSLNQHQTEI